MLTALLFDLDGTLTDTDTLHLQAFRQLLREHDGRELSQAQFDAQVSGRANGELFWCHVSGRALNRDDPHASGIWSFEDLSSQRPVRAELTGREREVAAFLMGGLTSKEIGKTLGISHRTVEIYRARLMRKYQAHSTPDLVHRLLAG